MQKRINTSFTYNPWIYSILSTVLILLFVTSIIITQSIISYDAKINQKLNSAVQVIDENIQEKDDAFAKVKALGDKPCSELRQKLVDIKMQHNQLQTLNIIRDGQVSCSSNPKMTLSSRVFQVENNQLHATISEIIHPGDVLFYINDIQNGNGVFATFSVKDIREPLTYISDESENLRIKTEDIQIDKNGNIFHDDLDKKTKHFSSEKYGYDVRISTSFQDYIDNLWRHYSAILIFFVAITLLVGRYIHFRVLKNSTLFFMRISIKRNEFIPFAQPIMDTQGNLAGCEILMRWKNKKQGFIFPDQFIPQAEQSGLIIPMTKQMMANTYDQFKACEGKLPHNFHIGINLSPQHFEPQHKHVIIGSCQKFADDSISNKVNLILELTERNELENYAQTQLIFDEMNKMNVKLAIDDFGTGHSTLTYIQKLNFDFIKIDKSFIDYIGSSAISAPLVDNIIDLSQRLNVPIVAEGVETKEQLDYLRNKKVDLIQGYYFSRPIPLEEFIQKYISQTSPK